MPNWNENTLSISNLTKEEVVKFKKLMTTVDGEEFLDFDKIIPMPEELKGTASPSVRDEELIKKYGYSDWYYWSVANWGTKWNSSACSMFVDESPFEEQLGITLDFNTAWTPPIPITKKLGRMFPNALIELEYFEPGCSFMGTVTVKGKKVSETYSEDINEMKAKYPDWYEDEDADEMEVNVSNKDLANEIEMNEEIVCPKCKKVIDHLVEERFIQNYYAVYPDGDNFVANLRDTGDDLKDPQYYCPECDAVLATMENNAKALFTNPLNNPEHIQLVDEKINQEIQDNLADDLIGDSDIKD